MNSPSSSGNDVQLALRVWEGLLGGWYEGQGVMGFGEKGPDLLGSSTEGLVLEKDLVGYMLDRKRAGDMQGGPGIVQ